MYTCLFDILTAEKKAAVEIEFQTKEQERLRKDWDSLVSAIAAQGTTINNSDYFVRQKNIFQDQINVCIAARHKAENDLELSRSAIKKYFAEL